MKRASAVNGQPSGRRAVGDGGIAVRRCPPPGPAMREAVRRQRDYLLAAVAVEFDYVLERVRAAAPEVADHPFLPDLLRDRHRGKTFDMPQGWLDEVPAECRKAVTELPWPSRADRESISIGQCKRLLGRRAVHFGDHHVRFVRDVLYAIAEVVVDEALEGKA